MNTYIHTNKKHRWNRERVTKICIQQACPCCSFLMPSEQGSGGFSPQMRFTPVFPLESVSKAQASADEMGCKVLSLPISNPNKNRNMRLGGLFPKLWKVLRVSYIRHRKYEISHEMTFSDHGRATGDVCMYSSFTVRSVRTSRISDCL